MPDADGFPYPHEISDAQAPPPEEDTPMPFQGMLVPLPPGVTAADLTDEQLRAAALAFSGVSFMLIAMCPTVPKGDGFGPAAAWADATGCDFFTVLHGDPQVLVAGKDALAGVIDRLYKKKGIM